MLSNTWSRVWPRASSAGRIGFHSSSGQVSASTTALAGVAGVDRATIRVVAFEVIGVDHDLLDVPAPAELDDRPVVSRPAAAPGLPAVAHVRGAAGHDQVLLRAEEHVARRHHDATVLDRGEIDEPRWSGASASPGPRGRGRAKARDAAVGIDVEPEVSHAPVARDREQVLRSGWSGDLGRISVHSSGSRATLARRIAIDRAGLDRGVGRMVAEEVVGVDVDTRGSTPGEAEPDRCTSRGRARACAGIPSRPSTCRGRCTSSGEEDAAAGLEQILLRREELVARNQGAAAQALGGEIDEPGERSGGRLFRIHECASSEALGLLTRERARTPRASGARNGSAS